MKKAMIAAALLAATAMPAAAQTAAPAAPAVPPSLSQAADSPQLVAKKQEVARKLIKLMRPVWDEEQIGRIMLIGWYSGAAAMCDDIEVDQAKLGRAVSAILPPDAAKLAPDKRRFLGESLLMHIGMATGLIMGSHYRDVPALCADARQAMADLPADKHLFQAADTEPPK